MKHARPVFGDPCRRTARSGRVPALLLAGMGLGVVLSSAAWYAWHRSEREAWEAARPPQRAAERPLRTAGRPPDPGDAAGASTGPDPRDLEITALRGRVAELEAAAAASPAGPAAAATPDAAADPVEPKKLLAEWLAALEAGQHDKAREIAKALLKRGDPGRDLLRAVVADEALPGETRLAAAATLAGAGDGAVAPFLLSVIQSSEDPLARREAVQGLAQVAGADSVPPLMELLKTDGDFLVRSFAATGLGRAGGAEAGAALKTAYETEQHGMVRAFALRGMAEHPTPDLLPVFGKVLATPGSRDEMRLAAVQGAGRIGGAGALSILEGVILDDKSKAIRNAARQQANTIRGTEAYPLEK